MQTGLQNLVRGKWTASAIGLLTACWAANLQATDPELFPNRPSDEKPLLDNPAAGWGADYTNWVEVGVGGFFVQGNKAVFQQRSQMPADVFGGLESLHYERALNKDWLFQLDGRGIGNNDDFMIKLDVNNPKVGFLRGGYREFRTWYARDGGFSPLGNRWITPFGEEVHIDRGEAWIEGGLTLPDLPKFTFGYTRAFRYGIKDSTSWGDAAVVGTTTRGIVPSFWNIDENRNIFRADMTHTISKTDFGVGVRYEFSDQRNEKDILRRPGERSERAVTQNDDLNSDMFNAHAFTQTRLTEKVLLTSGYSYTDLHSDTWGSRVYGSDFEAIYDPTFARRQQHDEGFLNLNGSSEMRQYLMNLNLMVTPWDYFSIRPGVRVERMDERAVSSYVSTDVPGTDLVATQDPLEDRNDRSWTDVSESLEARYTGLRNWSFYARGDWTEGDGSLVETRQTLTDGLTEVLRDRDSDRFSQKYSVGANWYPFQRLNFAAQYYHKILDNTYEHNPDQAETPLIQIQDFKTDDINFRVTWRPWANVTFVTRYDFQLSTVDTKAPPSASFPQGLGSIQSAEITSHIISESVSWSPMSKLYLQGNLNYVLDSTDTPADTWPVGTSPIVYQSENNYWNVSALVGVNVDIKTDLQFQYYYYRANGYQNFSSATQPYGAGAEEQGVTATLFRQITRAMRWSLKYGFFTNHDRLYGSHEDYNAHLVYSSIQYRF